MTSSVSRLALALALALGLLAASSAAAAAISAAVPLAAVAKNAIQEQYVKALPGARCFPRDFLFGTATAAFQVEGAWNASGREPSIWDAYCRASPDVACADVADDFYHRYKQDVALMADMGLSSFRFSISWSRVMHWDAASRRMAPTAGGIAFYHALLDDLLAHGLTPIATLYHFDLPASLHAQLQPEGWLNREIVGHFADFARLAFREFGAKVRYWATFNEPLTFISGGYGSCDAAPGDMPPSDTNTYTVAHHVLLSHAEAVKAFRTMRRQHEQLQHRHGVRLATDSDIVPIRRDARIGIVLNGEFGYPKDPASARDVEAAERKMQFELGWFMAPLVTGDYPPVMRERVGGRLPRFSPEEASVLKGSYDLFMLNHYYSRVVTDCDSPTSTVSCADLARGYQRDKGMDDAHPPAGARLPPADNPICSWLTGYPRGYLDTIKWVHAQDSTAEILLTENGWCGNDQVDNPDQLWYLQSYLEQVHKAIFEHAIPIIGYTVWSFVDNNEWGSYLPRFGLFYVNFTSPSTGIGGGDQDAASDASLERIPRPAATWFAGVATSGCLETLDASVAQRVNVAGAETKDEEGDVTDDVSTDEDDDEAVGGRSELEGEDDLQVAPWSLAFVIVVFAVGAVLMVFIGHETLRQLETFHADAAAAPLLGAR